MLPRLAIAGTTGLPAKYGGFETLTHHLVLKLGQYFDITVYCSSKYFAKKGRRKERVQGAKLHYFPLNANGYQSILYDILSIFHALRHSDAVLMLGISGTIILPLVKFISRKPILVNIDGQEWKRGKWNWWAKKFLRLSERLAVRYADVVIADNKVIADYVRKEYQREAVVIAYGGDHTVKPEVTNEARTKYSFLTKPYAFTVCRVEPENNVNMILDAFSRIPHWTFVMVGLWDHSRFGMDLRKKYSSFPNIILLDPIYHQEELDMIRANANVYVHGHSAGGTNPSLVEAMTLGLPVLCYNVAYNRETTAQKAFYFSNVEDIVDILNETGKRDLEQSGELLARIARVRYTWGEISAAYLGAIFVAMEQPLPSPELAVEDYLMEFELMNAKAA